jgi:hypothetical protein
MSLIGGSFIECVTQVDELVPLILVTLLLSLIEHHHFRLLNIHFQFFLRHILSQVLHHFFHFYFSVCHNYGLHFVVFMATNFNNFFFFFVYKTQEKFLFHVYYDNKYFTTLKNPTTIF